MLTLKSLIAESLNRLGGLAEGYTTVPDSRNGIRIPFERQESEDDESTDETTVE